MLLFFNYRDLWYNTVWKNNLAVLRRADYEDNVIFEAQK
jgi:hypothetical protein